ncbi:MAG TPA: arginase family protein, partial [Thermoleophilia bacterium]|nr:arginase family protein [Thermoleophilia bacterium]
MDPRTDDPEVPRFAGIDTFLRLPFEVQVGVADVAVLGLPFDGSATYRPGARFGPGAVRRASARLAGAEYNAVQRVAVFDRLTAVDA